ncbi:hypothetical protein RSAG8_12127, partial [Rhizoctonia solani AG-8 WAC10335]
MLSNTSKFLLFHVRVLRLSIFNLGDCGILPLGGAIHWSLISSGLSAPLRNTDMSGGQTAQGGKQRHELDILHKSPHRFIHVERSAPERHYTEEARQLINPPEHPDLEHSSV